MGHIVNPDKDYLSLQERLDKMVTGAPKSDSFMQILKILYTEEEAKIAQKLPTIPKSVGSLSKALNIPYDELDEKLTVMAQKGLVFDVIIKGKKLVSLSPVIIGFFEYTYMRTRDNLPMKELSKLFKEYMFESDALANAVFNHDTQLSRALVHEEAINEETHSEIMDYERSSKVIENARVIGVSLCSCRHKNYHLGTACDAPIENCLSFDIGAKSLIRNGIAKEISTSDAMQILEQAKEHGLVQVGDNVKSRVTFLCNCCGCCCGQLNAIKQFDIRNAVITSSWRPHFDYSMCTGCGKCVKKCPVGAMTLEPEPIGTPKNSQKPKRKKIPVVMDEICIGCGVCVGACKDNSLSMKKSKKKIFTPETHLDKIILMAIERGKLSDIIFDNPDKLSHKVLGKISNLIETSPVVKAAISNGTIKSMFFNQISAGISFFNK